MIYFGLPGRKLVRGLLYWAWDEENQEGMWVTDRGIIHSPSVLRYPDSFCEGAPLYKFIRIQRPSDIVESWLELDEGI